MFDEAIQEIDRQNSKGGQWVSYKGKQCQKELLHSELMVKWVKELDPSAEEVQLLAARASHLRRWELPRNSYPSGRAGYLRWRKEQSRRHSVLVEKILKDVGYGAQIISRAKDIIQKKNLKSDSQVQAHEDALCLVFLEIEFEDFKNRLIKEEGKENGLEKLAGVIKKTRAKMSPSAERRAEKIIKEMSSEDEKQLWDGKIALVE